MRSRRAVLLGALCAVGSLLPGQPAVRTASTAEPAPLAVLLEGAAEPVSLAAVPVASLAPPPLSQSYEFQAGVLCPFCQLTPSAPGGRSGLHWHDHWRTSKTYDYVAVVGLVAALGVTQLVLPAPTRARWDEPILFDATLR